MVGLYVRLYRFRQTHGTFKKRRVAASTSANKAISFILCAPLEQPHTQAILYPPTADRRLIAITFSDPAILSKTYSCHLFISTHSCRYFCKPNPAQHSGRSDRRITRDLQLRTSHCFTAGSIFTTTQLTFQDSFAGHCSSTFSIQVCPLPSNNTHTSFRCWSDPVSLVTLPT